MDALPSLLRAAPNFRDIGGLHVADGRQVRSGLIYRSDALDELDADDLERLSRLSLKVCFDLRSEGERLQRPSRWPEGGAPTILNLAVASDIRALLPDLQRELRSNPTADGAMWLMRHLYRDLPSACTAVLRRVFSLVLDEQDALPMVIHCTAGKDRTGFVIAMLLQALGVGSFAVVADYLRSNDSGGREHQNDKIGKLMEVLLGFAPPPAMLQAITVARADYLQAAFDRLIEDYGSADGYLADAVGLDSARRRRLEARLLVA